MGDTRRDAIISFFDRWSEIQFNNWYLNLSVDCMNSVLKTNKALFLSPFSFSLPKSKSLVIDKSFCCKILESMRFIFSKNVFLAQRAVIEAVKK